MSEAKTVRNFFGPVKMVEGDMGRGVILVAEDRRLGDVPIASINIPFKDQETNLKVARFLTEAWNEAR